MWSADILDELDTVLVREAGLNPQQAARRIAHMAAAFPLSEVTDYGAQVLVTFDLGDFPVEAFAPHDVTVVSPDSFLLDRLDLHPDKVTRALTGG